MEYEAVIGIEIHIQMKTVSKMFSCGPVSYGDEPNTNVNLTDMAFPGVLPLPNKQAIINAIRVCNALHMDIDKTVVFDRKNYFYSDLPKGYQITQQFRPIGSDGYLIIDIDGQERRIGIERLHLEEDTCKQIHLGDYSLLDYNRAGIPLVEIVSYPEIRCGEEAAKYAERIRSIVSYLDVSNGKMEEGSLRCAVNISLKRIGSNSFGTKVEIKNINSFKNIQKAIEYEIERQSSILEDGGKVIQETRRYDETSRKTVLMRVKTDVEDYKCFTEPNIPPIALSEEFIKEAIETSPELAEERLVRYKELGLNNYDSSLILANKDISDYFDEVVESGANPKLIANWINKDVQSYLNKHNIEIDQFKVSPLNLGKLILLVELNKISNKQAREIFETMTETGEDPDVLVVKLNLIQLSDEKELLNMIVTLLDENPELIEDYKNGKDRVLSFFVGKIMEKTKGKANPRLTSELLIQEIKRR